MEFVSPLVSVVVPIYNVEQYLDVCMQSLIDQTYANIEIIVVDDGSFDSCPQKCDNWAIGDSRVHVIHTANAGVSAARNKGLSVAAGEYVCFVDSDDFVENSYIETMLRNATMYQADIVFCGYRTVNYAAGSYIPVKRNNRVSFVAKGNLAFREGFISLAHSGVVNPPWCKMFRRTFLMRNNAQFPVGIIAGEDSMFAYPLYAHADRVVAIDDALYNYVVRCGSVSGKYDTRLFESRCATYAKVAPVIEQWVSEYINEYNNAFVYDIDVCLNSLFFSTPKVKKDEQCRLIQSILDSAEVRRCVSQVVPKGMRNRILASLLNRRSAICLFLYGRLVACIKRAKKIIVKAC